ncbi:hypothetical protein C8A05DRAFT_19491 [Staphylotrichum tortipilum]|uniref:Peptidase M20 dimerisation domain-containing protein n=1 Tax=Staphylotrichum tortipilum TaxID=2831512 RepID=A0AAN6MBA9_9PEZI|nr:hypothetical protein C8A05DRAFT_19491 [Staphylotrichum longicolle]
MSSAKTGDPANTVEDEGYILVPRPTDSRQRNRDCSRQDGADQAYLACIDQFVETQKDVLWPLNLFLHQNPELAFQEHKAHKALTEFLWSAENEWTVTPSAYGMETAWVAVYDSGRAGPTVSFNVEMDALPNLAHACGHNLIATASLAAGLATAEVIRRHKLAGKVVLFGTPGEEGYRGGKIRLLEKGAYDGVDISLLSHPGILHNSALVRTAAFARVSVEFFGQAAHAAKAPWKGINALDALVVSYNAVSMLRQQTMPGDVISLAITNGGGEATQLIHEYAACACVIRAASASRLDDLEQKVGASFRAGAQATGARVEISVTRGYKDHIPNRVLAASYAHCWNALPGVPDPPMPPVTPGHQHFTWILSSTDQGDLSYAMPSVNASFAIPPGPGGGQPHSADFERASGTREAFDRALRVGKALAGTAVDVLSRQGLLATAKRQWQEDMSQEGQRRLLPPNEGLSEL